MSTNIRITRICEYCSAEFTARTIKTRFCSHTCNSRAYKARKREEKLHSVQKAVDKVASIHIEDINKKEFLSISEACDLMGLSRWTLWRAIKNNELKAASIGNRKLIRRVDIDALFKHTSNEISNEWDTTSAEQLTNISFDRSNYYTISEAQEKYRMSASAFYDLLKRNQVNKMRKGRFVYVAKSEIDPLFLIIPKSVSK